MEVDMVADMVADMEVNTVADMEVDMMDMEIVDKVDMMGMVDIVDMRTLTWRTSKWWTWTWWTSNTTFTCHPSLSSIPKSRTFLAQFGLVLKQEFDVCTTKETYLFYHKILFSRIFTCVLYRLSSLVCKPENSISIQFHPIFTMKTHTQGTRSPARTFPCCWFANLIVNNSRQNLLLVGANNRRKSRSSQSGTEPIYWLLDHPAAAPWPKLDVYHILCFILDKTNSSWLQGRLSLSNTMNLRIFFRLGFSKISCIFSLKKSSKSTFWALIRFGGGSPPIPRPWVKK